MEKLILDFCDLPFTGLMTEELFYLKVDKPAVQDKSATLKSEQPEPAEIIENRPEVVSIPLKNFQTLGLYKKPLLFISAPESGSHTEHETGLLENILKALNLSMDDIAFLELKSGEPVILQRILEEYRPRLLLSFGAGNIIDGWPVSILNEPVKYEQVMYLQAVSLQMLTRDKNQKLLLWTALKTLFKIK